MNLFIIPSWYPSCSTPIAGVFTKEQAEALGDLIPELRVIVSLWGHAESELVFRSPLCWFERMLWCRKQPCDQVRKNNTIEEVFNPKLHWTRRLPFGGAKQLVEVNRRNFKLATDRFGRIDIIHAHVSYPAGYIASILSLEFGVPYVLTEHMSPFPFSSLTQGGLPIPEIAQAFSGAAASIAVSPSLAERIMSFGYPAPKVIPNMVDDRLFRLGRSRTGKTVFFTLCGISEQKGIDILLDAIALWNPPADRFEFRIGGDGPLSETYKARARILGLDDRVCWLGPISRDEAPKLFRDCDIYVMPSRHETFGVVYAEALASGKPVIATRCGGPEYIVNNSNGVLVEIGDLAGLCQAMQSMAMNLSAYDSRIIRQDFERRFSRTAVVQQLYELYEEVLEG